MRWATGSWLNPARCDGFGMVWLPCRPQQQKQLLFALCDGEATLVVVGAMD